MSIYPFFAGIVPLIVAFTLAGCASDEISPSDASQDSDSSDTSDTAQDTDSTLDTDSDSETVLDTATETDIPVDTFTEVTTAEIGDVPFNPDTVLEYHITMEPPLWEEMQAYGNDEMYREASVHITGTGVDEQYGTIGFRYKGDYSLHHCWDENGGVRNHYGDCAKLSTRIKFNEFAPDSRFYGLKNINLHAMAADETLLRERLAYSVFNDSGVDAPRTAHALLYINDEPPLLVLAVEQIDGRYTARHYPDGGDGNLYEDAWPTMAISEYTLLDMLRTNDKPEDNPDVSDFTAFGAAAQAATRDTFEADMAPFVELDQLLRYMAVDRAFKNWDGFTAFYWPDRPHNYYWYHDNGTEDRFHLIPWDMDKTMWQYDPYMDPLNNYAETPVPDWNVKPLSCARISVWDSGGALTVLPPGCDHFINLLADVMWSDFAIIGDDLLNSTMNYDTMNEKITTWAEQIAPFVAEDPYLFPASWEGTVEEFRTILQDNILEFEAHLGEGYVVE